MNKQLEGTRSTPINDTKRLSVEEKVKIEKILKDGIESRCKELDDDFTRRFNAAAEDVARELGVDKKKKRLAEIEKEIAEIREFFSANGFSYEGRITPPYFGWKIVERIEEEKNETLRRVYEKGNLVALAKEQASFATLDIVAVRAKLYLSETYRDAKMILRDFVGKDIL